MATVKAGRNKTIGTPLSEGKVYIERTVLLSRKSRQTLARFWIKPLLVICLMFVRYYLTKA